MTRRFGSLRCRAGQVVGSHLQADMWRALLPCALLLGVFLTACGPLPPTPYQAAKGGGFGYAEEFQERDVLLVTFDANAETPGETVLNYALYRAAEIARDREVTRFVLLDKTLLRDEQVWHDYGYGPYRPYAVGADWGYYPPLYGPVPSYTRSLRYRAALRVRMLPDGAAPDPASLPLGSSILKTAEVLSKLGPGIVRPGKGD